MTTKPKRLTAASVVTNRLLQSQIEAIVGQIVAHHELIEDLLARVKALEARGTQDSANLAALASCVRPIGGSAHNPANSKIRRKKACS